MDVAQNTQDTVESLAQRYKFDLAHTRHVADLALRIFDATRAKHGLNARARGLLETGALLHDIAFNLDEERHHTLGRDLILASSLDGATPVERAVIALLAAFHRKNISPENEPVFVALKPGAQRVTLVLSAILRVADGLDYSHTQTTSIKQINGGELELRGARCHEDAARAIRKADVWAGLSAKDQLPTLFLRPRLKRPGILAQDTLDIAARRVIQYQHDRIPQVDETLTAEQTRQLRVALRRLRVSMLALHTSLRRKRLLKYMDELREVLAAVSDARECDMRAERLQTSLTPGLAPLQDNWQRKRAKARARLLGCLRSPAWARVMQLQPGRMVSQRAAGETAQHFAPPLLRRLMDDVLAFEPQLGAASAEEMHRLRVAVRRLRMMTDAFGEILPREETRPLLKACKETQATLGAAHDAHATALAARKFALTARGIPAAAEINAFAESLEAQAASNGKPLAVFEAIRKCKV